jgi:hypothetical protein
VCKNTDTNYKYVSGDCKMIGKNKSTCIFTENRKDANGLLTTVSTQGTQCI